MLTNDIDANGNLFTAHLFTVRRTAPCAGPGWRVHLHLDPKYTGTDSFTYEDIGVDGTSNVATVTLTVVPKVFVVTNTTDSGTGSLRRAIGTPTWPPAPAPDTIQFDIPGTGPFPIAR